MPVKQANAGLCSGSIVIDPITGFATTAINAFTTSVKWVWENAVEMYKKYANFETLKGIKIGNVISKAKSVYEKIKPYIIKAGKVAWSVTRKKLLNELVNYIIKEIQGGENKKPKFVTDWKGFLRDAANEAGGQFIESDPDLAFLCDSFGTEVRVALGTVPPFGEKVGCTLDQVAKNIENFYDDLRVGGWDGWIKLSQSNNNIFGAYYDVQGEKISREMRAKEAATNEAMSGGGFLGTTGCLQWSCNDDQLWDFNDCMKDKKHEINECYRAADCQCVKEGTLTPGKVLADSVSKTATLDIDWLISAKEFNEYAGAIFDAVWNRMARGGLAFMKTDNYVPSVSDEQTYNDMMRKLNEEEALADRMASGQAYGEDGSVNIAEREGQRKLLAEFRKILRTLKRDIKKVVDYLREQDKDINALVECAGFKYDMCVEHANDKNSAFTDEICGSLKDDCLSDKAAACAAEKKKCEDSKLGDCASKETSCNQIGIQECNKENVNCHIAAKNVLSLEMKNRCDEASVRGSDTKSILEEKEIAEDFKDYLSIREKIMQMERIYAVLPFDISLTDNLLQKLENYKPFDECGEKFCSSEENSQECRAMVWGNPSQKNIFINGTKENNFSDGKCGILPDDIKEKCALFESEDEKSGCEAEWKEKCKDEWNNKMSRIVKEDNTEKEIFGACFARKVFVISDSYEDFAKNLNISTKAECGENPSLECSSKVYNQIDDPLNKCIREETPNCMKNTGRTEIQCYNDLTAFPRTASFQDPVQQAYTGKCYEKQYRNLTYEELIKDEFTRITDEDMEFLAEIQDQKHSEYSEIQGELSQNLRSMSRGEEECYDGFKLSSATTNEYEQTYRCLQMAMDRCAWIPPGSYGYSWKHLRQFFGMDVWASFGAQGTDCKAKAGWYDCNYNIGNWESWQRGCWSCTVCLEASCAGNYADCPQCDFACGTYPECISWWSSAKNPGSVSYEIPAFKAKEKDVWNTIEDPNWKWLFDLSRDSDADGIADMEEIKKEIKEELDSGNLEAVLNEKILSSQIPNSENNKIESSCCD